MATLNVLVSMSEKYTREELEKVSNSEFPEKGTFCNKCKTWIPQFEELDEVTESRIKKLINEQNQIMAMRELEAKVGCNQRWSITYKFSETMPSLL